MREESKEPRLRARADGKFFFVGDRKFYIKGVSYGPFGSQHGGEYRDPVQTECDFRRIRSLGANTIRTYTLPPEWLLDCASAHGLQALVGLPWAQHVAFLEDRRLSGDIEKQVRIGARFCAGHPAVLGLAIGNEIPGSVVRWHGKRRVERFLRRLFMAAKEVDPELLVTYVNYPTTEYLELPFLDFFSVNVYLEKREKLAAYLLRLQNMAANRPLLIAETGVDSRRLSLAGQAQIMSWQLEEIFKAGSTGAFVFAWSDQWHRGGLDVDDWDFGLVDRQGREKPAFWAVRDAFASLPFADLDRRPPISVVVCVFNGEDTIGRCLEGLRNLNYPDYEVIVVDDGSKDKTARIIDRFESTPQFRVLRTENRGLSSARNTGFLQARGEIVAYLDADAYPDPDWLSYLADHFASSDDAGAGGPNIPPPRNGLTAECVARAPGGPVHILLSDREAEHVPGCNMAFRRACLQEVGGFDDRFRVAGDDVDLCWRMQERGWKLGFCHGAMVWHYSRPTVGQYWRQQKGYGRAEALLECKWPEKYNTLGYANWRGRIYDGGLSSALLLGRWRVYHGVWGSGLFQSIYQESPGLLRSLPLTPDWYLIMIVLAFISALGFFWKPLFLASALLAGCAAAMAAQALGRAHAALVRTPWQSRSRRIKMFGALVFLHLLQPLARLRGRLGRGLELTRRSGLRLAAPWPRTFQLWNESWQSPQQMLMALEDALTAEGAVVARGGQWDRWDLEVRGGVIGAARLRMLAEEHGRGRQLVRFVLEPIWSTEGLFITPIFLGLALLAIFQQAWAGAAALMALTAVFGLRGLFECSVALGSLSRLLSSHPRKVGGSRN